MANTDRKKLLCLFDVDGTLTKPRLTIDDNMEKFMIEEVMSKCCVGLVGGSDIGKISEQMRSKEVATKFDYFFSENGLVAYRTGLINLCPVGRSCSYEERLQFAKYDEEHNIRRTFKAELDKKFGNLGLQFAMGGQISIDCFPTGWDKTYCLQFVEGAGHEVIHFFGDKTAAGGNDHEIFEDSRTIGHTVIGPEDTKEQLKKLLNL